jgi:diphthamide biosynthesis methyltransferase
MTTPSDLVYNSIYKGSKAEGVDELTAKDAAIMGLQKYKNGQYVTPSKLVKDAIVQAKKNRLKKPKQSNNKG